MQIYLCMILLKVGVGYRLDDSFSGYGKFPSNG